MPSQKTAWQDFLPHVQALENWDVSLTTRLKEIMLYEEPEPFSAIELNKLTKDKSCPCPIREALISWTNFDIPDQQTICEEGAKLISL